MKYTNAGRVVYARKKHYMGLKDVVRQCEALSIRLTKTELAANPYMCNALFEIVRTAFYPTWQRTLRPRPPAKEDEDFYIALKGYLQQRWRDATIQVIEEVADQVGVPEGVQNFVLFYFFDIIWDVIWKLTDPFFAYQD